MYPPSSADTTNCILDMTTARTVSNKVLNNTNTFSGYTDWTEIAAPGNPAASTVRVYAKSASGEICAKSSAGV